MDELLNAIQLYLPVLKAWLIDLRPWVDTIALFVAVIALIYARQSYKLQITSYKDSKIFKEELKLKNKELDEKQKKEVPEKISFGKKILLVSNFDESGIPKDLASLGIFESKVQIGDWVEAEDELLTVTYRIFYENEKPKGRFAKYRDNYYSSDPISLQSPVAGLVIGFRTERVGYQFGNINSYPYYMEINTFPIILLPVDEPSQNTYVIKLFYNQIVNTLKNNKSRLLYGEGGYGYIRAKEHKPELERVDISESPMEEFEVREIDLDKKDSSLMYNIEKLRRKHIAREKLIHLVRQEE